jgi:tRNA (mo5U34)-methyltransferase
LEKAWRFDSDLARSFTEARQSVIRNLLGSIREPMKLDSALDVGCGVGYFSKFLADLGFRVTAIDGREENVQDGRKRYPHIEFRVGNAEELVALGLGAFDFVLCVGLIYHLENPFRAIRGLFSLTNRVLVIESMCAAGEDPSLQLVDETGSEDQGLSYVAFYPTETCLVKMLYRAGFPYVYNFRELPDYPLFRASVWKRKERAILVASKEPLEASCLVLVPDVKGSWEILSSRRERLKLKLDRLIGRW